jgi:PAS domain S-box-containing protein
MADGKQTKAQLVDELVVLRQRIATLEAAATECQETEQALRESEELHRLALSNISDTVFITNDAGAFTFICPNVNVIFGYSAHEVRQFGNIVKLFGSALCTRDDLEALGELQNVEQEITDKAGRRHVVLVNVKRVSIQNGTRLYICRDITRRKRIEEALRASEERLALTLDATTDGVWDWNIATGEVFFSPHWFESLGYAPGELTPHIRVREQLVHPEDRSRVQQVLQAHLEGRRPMYECDNRLLTKSGAWRWNHTRGKVVARDEHGTPLRMIGTDVDITDRKHAEQELQRADRLALVGQLTSGLAHEIGTPLNIIAGNAELLRMDLQEQGHLTHTLEAIVAQADRITGLIEQLLTFARAKPQPTESFALHEPLSNALRLLQTRFSREAITTTVEVPTDLPLVGGTANHIEQVFLNVLVNAWHAMPDGGTVTIQAEVADERYVRIVFRDTGVGMSAEGLKRAFEPFYSTKGEQGTGLGLTMCQQIIETHHGIIHLDSTPGVGTTVTIALLQADATP